MSTESFTKDFTLDEKSAKSLLDIMGVIEYYVYDKKNKTFIEKDNGERVVITNKKAYEDFYGEFKVSPIDSLEFIEVED